LHRSAHWAMQDEVADVNDLRLWLTVNGKKMQDGNTANYILKIPTHRVKFEGLKDVFETWLDSSRRVIKALVELD